MTRLHGTSTALLALAALVCVTTSAVGQSVRNQELISEKFQPLPTNEQNSNAVELFEESGALSDDMVTNDYFAGMAGFRPLLGRHVFGRPLFGIFKTAPGPNRGVGRPLTRESWLHRPFSAGWFMGMAQGSPLIDDWIGLQQGYVGGYRFGWDETHYWGGEMRFSFASVELLDSQRAIDTQTTDYPQWNDKFNQRRDADVFQWDVCVLYYPWGNAQWRPYMAAGVGCSRTIFLDRLSNHYDQITFAMPLAVGVKYRCNDSLALRLELADNIAFAGGGIETTHNLLLTGGIEVRFGGSRTAYWPWNPGRHYW